MPNEPIKDTKPIRSSELQELTTNLAQKGIIIENETKDLIRSGLFDWSSPFGQNIAHQKELIRQLTEFVETHPKVEAIHVEFLRWNDAYYRYSSLLGKTSPENPPDIIQIGSTWTADFAKKGLLEPLDNISENSAFLPASLKSCGIENDDVTYAIPWFVDVRLIYYWKRYFPDGNVSFASLKTFEDSLKKIRGIPPFTIPIGISWNLMHNFAPWVWANGGDLYYAPWDSRPFKDAVAYLHLLAGQDLLNLPSKSLDDTELEFMDEKTAAILSISDLTSRLHSNWQKDIGIAPMPAGSSGSHSFLGGSHLAITKFARDRFEETADLLKYMANAENELKYSLSSGFLTPNEDALEKLITMRPELAVFKTALANGKSYPSIPEWGEIFENEISRTYLYNLWNDIALGKPLPVVLATLSDISDQLNKRLMQRALARYSLPAAAILAATLAALIASIILWRKKRSYFIDKLEGLGSQIQMLTGQKVVLEGQIALLEKHGDVQTEELHRSKERLASLESQIDDLAGRLERIRTKQFKPASLPKFHIKSDGTVIVNENEISFENKRQAKHLIEYIIRHAHHNHTIVHCIKGFILFDWTNLKDDSNPKRLFDTVVSKINTPLKKAGFPPILVSSGRDSWQWNVAWDIKRFEQNLDIILAKRESEQARELFYRGDIEKAADGIIASLCFDPKCAEALSLLQELRLENTKLEKLKLAGNQTMQRSLDLCSTGLLAAKEHVKNLKRSSKEAWASRIENEIGLLEAEVNSEKSLFLNLFSSRLGQPLYLKEINDQLSSIWQNISGLKEKGLKNCDIWAQITQDRHFLTLLSLPQFNDLIHNFYDHSTKELEDPRLVKLAMILMLNEDKCITELKDISDGKIFFKTIERHVRKQFRNLEQEIGKWEQM